MNTRGYNHIIAVKYAVWVLTVAFAFGASVDAAESISDAMWEEYKAEESEILFYGRVVDQHDQPVAACIVTINVSIPIGYLREKARKCQVRTDTEGRFIVSNKLFGLAALRGTSLCIEGIEKAQYEYVRGSDPNLCFSYRKGDIDRHEPDPEAPAVFHMRKKEANGVFLLEYPYMELRVDVSNSGDVIECDNIQGRGFRGGELFVDSGMHECDIRVMAVFMTNIATWSVTLAAENTNGGIVMSERLLYEAPEEGYQTELPLLIQGKADTGAKYVYLKSRVPEIYSRLEIKGINANDRFFRLIWKSVTNPYGDRNLEPAVGLPYEVTKRLTDEVKDAFRQNKRPARPDLDGLMLKTNGGAEIQP